MKKAALVAASLVVFACGRGQLVPPGASDWTGPAPGLGGHYDADRTHVRFRVYSAHATAAVVELFAEPLGAPSALTLELERENGGDVWTATVSTDALADRGIDTVYYGYRFWGPNWPRDVGFLSDVDSRGNRFNPNKLVLDPYAREISHDPEGPHHQGIDVYTSGPEHRGTDTATLAPKGVVIAPSDGGVSHPTRPFKDGIIYEVHLRGLTMNDPSVPAGIRGTYAGAARKASYLADLGVTAIELLPVFETKNDQNDLAPGVDGDNYWGYANWSFFSPDRRYAADRSPGGPTREFQEMVSAFHDEGIEVYLDVVYNHTAEGGTWGNHDQAVVLSWRGADNATYYQLDSSGRGYVNHNGVGPNLNVTQPAVRDLVLDSLKYWTGEMGVDGFRFDLAAVLGNGCETDCFQWQPHASDGVLARAVDELPGIDLMAEPWGIGSGTYQQGKFPAGWAEWNGRFRDVVRSDQNKMDVVDVAPSDLAARVEGSPDLFDDGRRPWHSVNYVVSHDGFTLRDLYACNDKNNDQQWPYGPSPGGENENLSWDQSGDPVRQRQAARTGMALVLLSAGVPMMTGGDELYRTQYCNNNPYNLDSDKNWLDWAAADASMQAFTRWVMHFRSAHPSLRPDAFFTHSDGDGNGVKDITWITDQGVEATYEYYYDAGNHFLGWRIDAAELGEENASSIYVAYNGWNQKISGALLPDAAPGRAWYLAGESAAGGSFYDDAGSYPLVGKSFDILPRSLSVFVER